jgi:hypothetical protein
VEPHVARNFTGYFNPLPELCIFRGKGVSGTVIDFLRKQRFYRRRLLENSFFRSYYRYIARKYEPRFAKYGYSLIKDCGIDDSILRERGLISDAIGALCCTGADMYAFLRRFALRVRCLIKRQIKRVLPELVLAKIRKVRDVRSRRRKGSDRRMDLGYRKPAVRN